MGEPAQVFEGVGHALQEVRLPFVEAPETVSAQSLQDADVNVRVVVLHEVCAVYFDVIRKTIEVVVEQLLAQLGRKIGFAIVEKRGNVVLQRAFAAALVVEKERLA